MTEAVANDSGAFEEAVTWATKWSIAWAGDLREEFCIDGIDVVSYLRVEIYNVLFRLALRGAGPGSARLSPIETLKRTGLDRAVRTIALRMMAADDRSDSPPTEVVFLSEMASPSALLPSMEVARRLPPTSFAVISSDVRAARRWRARKAPVRRMLMTLPGEWTERRAFGAKLRDAWSVRRDARLDVQLRGRDVGSDLVRAIKPVIERSGPWLAVERRAMEAAVDDLRPRAFILASDQHRNGRMVVDVAASRGIRTIVLQHGQPQATVGYVPVVADQVAVWSEASRDWFLNQGTDVRRLALLGNPRLDRLLRADRSLAARTVSDRWNLPAGPRILVPLSPNDPERVERQVRIALELLTHDPTASAIVKLHPGVRDWTAIRRQLQENTTSAERVRVLHHDDLGPLLLAADVALVHRSTVAVEAMAVGTPTVATTDPASSADHELGAVNLPRVTTGEELLAVVRELTKPGGRDEFLASRRGEIERIAGPLDGRSAERIAGHVRAAVAAE